MAGLKDISSVWKNIKEIDLKPIRESATFPLRIAVVGAQGAGRHTLAEQMRTDPARPGVHTQSTMALLSIEAAVDVPDAHLIIVLVDATRSDFSEEQSLVKKWSEGGRNVLVFINKIDLVGGNIAKDAQQGWTASRVLFGSVNDIVNLEKEFIPAILELLPQQHIALGRQFPLFRLTIARQLINETCFSNAAYSFSTGLAEIVPVLDLPLNVTDLVVLTKSQAFLAYKLGLLLGFSTRWQDYVTEFGSVIGTGFLWRQIARSLIGLIPAWGIIPKVAVAYSGTYVVGNAILGWYLSGRKLSPKQMRALSAQAFSKGKDYAVKLAARIPRPRLGRGTKGRLPEPEISGELQGNEIIINTESTQHADVDLATGTGESALIANKQVEPLLKKALAARKDTARKLRPAKRLYIGRDKHEKAPATVRARTCAQCGKTSSIDAQFCQYCGVPFEA